MFLSDITDALTAKEIKEAANAQQQAAIAIKMKNQHKTPKNIDEHSDDTVIFGIDSENAYNQVMTKFGKAITWHGDDMVAPRKYWAAIQQLAHDAGGAAEETGYERDVAEANDPNFVGFMNKSLGNKVDRPKENPLANAPDFYKNAPVANLDTNSSQGRALKWGIGILQKISPAQKAKLASLDEYGVESWLEDLAVKQGMAMDYNNPGDDDDRDRFQFAQEDIGECQELLGDVFHDPNINTWLDLIKSEQGLTETRNSLFAFVKQHFPTWPDYVLKDFLYQQAKGIQDRAELDFFLKRNKKDFGNCKWTLVELPITFDIFTPKTQRMIKSREGGNSNPFRVPRDAERHALQSQMIQQKGVSSEPIIVAKLSNGYDLIEGWHRTIQHLKAFPNGYTAPAWVCTGATYKSESMQGVAEGGAGIANQQLSVQQLATISDEALDNAYHYGRSQPGNTFGWQANLKSAAYAKQMIDKGVTDIEAISDAIHKGWNVTAQAFVKNPMQFDDSKTMAPEKLQAKIAQRQKLMTQNYAQLPEEEKEKDRVVARAMLQAITGQPGVAEDSWHGTGDAWHGQDQVMEYVDSHMVPNDSSSAIPGTPGLNEEPGRVRMLKRLAKKTGWDLSDLEHLTDRELIELYKEHVKRLAEFNAADPAQGPGVDDSTSPIAGQQRLSLNKDISAPLPMNNMGISEQQEQRLIAVRLAEMKAAGYFD